MTKITPEDLVRYLYNETSDSKTTAIKAALQTDWNLRESFEKMVIAHQNLKKIDLSPSENSLNKILEYGAKKQNQLHSI